MAAMHGKLALSLLLVSSLAVHAAQEDTLRIVYFEAYPPYSSGKGAAVNGLFVDVLNEALGTRMKLKITHNGLPWARAQSMVASGEADAMVTLATAERLKYAVAGKQPVYTSDMRFYVGSQHPQLATLKQVNSIEAAKPYSIGSYIGSGWVAVHMPNFRIDSTPTFEQTLKKAAASRVDLVPGVSDQARQTIVELGLDKEIVELPTVIDSLHYQLLIRQTSSFSSVLPQIDTTLQAMRADGSLERIYSRHIKVIAKPTH